uniref:G protein signaling modulator 3 n=1 Tax=Chelydra serpentina TaxID=8475 RepID=A0A8C3SLG1_CHESE
QRCPLPGLRGAPRHPPARPWHSLPGTPTGTPGGHRPALSDPPGPPGRFCSLTSLQAEQFFELVATAQARRLDDQRADFVGDPGAEEGPKEGAEGPPEPPDQEEELYHTILTHQVRGGPLRDPQIPSGPPELFDLLLRVQGGRMEEQRSEPPRALLPHPC